MWVTAHHRGVYKDRSRFMDDLAAYTAKLEERSARLLAMLANGPRTLPELVAQRILYPVGYDGPWVVDAETRTIASTWTN